MSDLKIKEPVTVKGTIYLIIFAFMSASVVYIATYGAGQIGYAIRIGGSGIIFIIVLAILINKTHHPTYKDDSLAILGKNKEVVEQDATTNLKYRKFHHFDTEPRYFNLHQILEGKPNKNISIIGMSGSGKTVLAYKVIGEMQEYNKIIFQYKPPRDPNAVQKEEEKSDKYNELGYPTLKLRENSPDVFRDKEAFAMAWITAFSVVNRGITAGQILPLVRNAANASRNWKEFKEEIEKQERKERGTITREALRDIRLKLDSIYLENTFSEPLPKDIVIDCTGLTKEAFIFYTEAILRSTYKELLNKQRRGTMIIVDEAHLFANTSNTIIPELSALIRNSGSFMFITQRTSAIAGDIKGNAGTQFCFKQTEEDDLRVINAVSPLLGFAINELKIHEFLDLAQNGVNDAVLQLKLCNPKPQFYPEKVWKPEILNEEKIDYTTEAIKALDKARNIQSIARIIADKHGLNKEIVKRDILSVLNRQVSAGTINLMPVENAKLLRDRIQAVNEKIYFTPDTEQLHDYLVKCTGDILTWKNKNFTIEPSGKATPDITGDDFVIEIETGLKRRQDDLTERIEKAKKEGKMIFIIVPNKSLKAQYKNSMTISEFSTWIDEAENYGTKEEEKEETENE